MAGKNGRDQSGKSNFGLTGWLVILMLMAFGYCANGAMNDGLNTYVALFTEKFGWTSGQLLTYSTYAGWLSIPILIGCTQFARRQGARKTAVLSMSVAAVGMFLWARVDNQALYFLAVVLLVSASSSIMVIRDTTLNNWFPTKKGLALGWATMGPLLGTATILPLIGLGGKLWGFTGHFDIIAIGFVILLLISLFWFRDHPEDKGCFPDNDRTLTPERARALHEQGMRYSATSPWTVKKLLTTRQTWQIGVGVGGLNMLVGNAVMSQLIPTITSHGFTREEAMVMMTVLALCALPLSYLFGRVDAKWGTRVTIICFFGWTLVALILMMLPWRWSVYGAVFMIGGYIGGSGNIMGAMTTTVFGRYDFSRAFSVIYPMCMAVRSLAYTLIGTLRDISGSYFLPYLVLMGVAVLGMVNAFLMDDRLLGRNYLQGEEVQDG